MDGHPDGKAKGDAVGVAIGVGVKLGVATGGAVGRRLGLATSCDAVGASGVALASAAAAVLLDPRSAVDPMVEHPPSTMTAASDATRILMSA